MNTTVALFYLFSLVLLFASVRVITARSTVHAALYLVLAFGNAACLWLLLRAEFLAIALVLVYVGAVMVLFLFVVMMLDLNTDRFREGFWKHLPLAGLVGVVIALEMAFVLIRGFDVRNAPPLAEAAIKAGNTKMLGIAIYTEYLYPLQVAAVLLLVAIIAAISLTLRRRKDSRYLDPGEQVKARKADRLRIVQMPPVVEPPPAPPEPTGGAVPGEQNHERRAAAPEAFPSGDGRAAPKGAHVNLGAISLGHYLSLGGVLFALSVVGIYLNRRNLIVLLMAIELMLLAVNLNFVAFSHYLGDMEGQVFVFFILTVAAAESAIGLAILVVLFRNRATIDVEDLDALKG